MSSVHRGRGRNEEVVVAAGEGALARRGLAPLRARVALVLLAAGASAVGGCGGPSRPTESDIFHDPALRRGRIDADEAERELLASLDTLPEGGQVTVGGRVYVVARPYQAASGRTCRAVESAARSRLACTSDAGWVFVPDVVGGENPFASAGPSESAP